ncbi:MAG: hypothetical protein U0R19_38100 [Bryobacteraceae bacterium]
MYWILLLLGALPGIAAVADLSVAGSTSTQIIVTYTAPTEAACTVAVSKDAGYSPVVADVDAAIYAGSNLDSRPGALSQGRYRVVVLGRQGPTAIEAGGDGYHRSRSLQADTTYYIQVNCGADTATVTARTATIPLGDSRGEALGVGSDRPFEYQTVSSNSVMLPEFVDPYTGSVVKRPAVAFGYGGSTANNWSPGNADCNRTLSGVKGSCLFSDAAGTGWSATTGSVTDAVRGNDTNYAEYSGTLQEPLFIRLGVGKYPTSSTSEEVGAMSFQNVILRGLTTDSSGDGGAIDFCWVEDVAASNPPCISPLLQTTLTTLESTIRLCKDAPCTAAETPGDIMYDKAPPHVKMDPNTRVYNTAGDLFTWKFTGSGAQATCDSIPIGQYLQAMDTRSYSLRTVSVSAKSCASTPPQVTVSLDYDLTHNGTTGVTLFRAGSPNLGIRIRKVSTSSGATIKIGYALWRAAVGTPFQFANGSGGFGKRCQTIPLASGEYLCHMGQHIVGLTYGPNGVTLKNYGYNYINTSWLGVAGLASGNASYSCFGSAASNDTTWSDTVPGRLYCVLPSSYKNPASGVPDGRAVLVEFNVNTSSEKAAGNPDATGGPGLSAMAAALSFTSVRVVTKCLNTCSSEADDYTLAAQFKRFAPTWDYSKFYGTSVVAIQGSTAFLTVFSGSQDSHGWVFALDLGNEQDIGSGYVGSHGNTQHVFGGFLLAESQACRWCASHTFQAPLESGGAQFTVIETSTKCPMQITAASSLGTCSIGSGTCAACPNVTLDGYNYNGKGWCGTLNITTSWNGAWGATPSGWADGDPVAPNGCDNGAPNLRYWGQKLQVGDYLLHNNELVRILVKSGNTLTLVRGWGGYADGSTWGPKSHSNGDVWQVRCGAYLPNPEAKLDVYNVGAVAWWPALDPTGSNSLYTYWDPAQNHALHTGTVALHPAYPVYRFKLNSPSSLKAFAGSYLELPWRFAGATNGDTSGVVGASNCSGNGCEKHPAYGQAAGDANAKSWFADLHMRLSHGNNGKNAVALVAGKTYIYKWQGSQSVSPRLYDLEVYSAWWPLRRVDTLSDNASDSGKWCWAVVANDCFPGSTANSLYFVNEAFDTTFISTTDYTCREAEFGALNGDMCFGNTGGISNAITQWRLPEAGRYYPNGSAMRVVAKFGRTYREAATENVKIDPLGKMLFTRGGYYIVLPRFPGFDSRNRSTFEGVKVDIPTVPIDTSTVAIEFGYNTDFQCSRNRNDVCIAEKSLLDEAAPYKFAQETISGVPCSSSCTVTIPALHNRVLYYRTKFRNGLGATIAVGQTQVVAVN